METTLAAFLSVPAVIVYGPDRALSIFPRKEKGIR